MDHKGKKDHSTHLKEPHFEEIDTPLSLVSEWPKEDRLWEYPITQEQAVKTLTQSYARSLSQLPIFHSLPPKTKRNPRIFTLSEDTYVATSLEDIVIESLQIINTPWEEIHEDSPSRGNPSLDFENPNGEASNQNFPIHNMANVPPRCGNQPHLLREHSLPGLHRMLQRYLGSSIPYPKIKKECYLISTLSGEIPMITIFSLSSQPCIGWGSLMKMWCATYSLLHWLVPPPHCILAWE